MDVSALVNFISYHESTPLYCHPLSILACFHKDVICLEEIVPLEGKVVNQGSLPHWKNAGERLSIQKGLWCQAMCSEQIPLVTLPTQMCGMIVTIIINCGPFSGAISWISKEAWLISHHFCILAVHLVPVLQCTCSNLSIVMIGWLLMEKPNWRTQMHEVDTKNMMVLMCDTWERFISFSLENYVGHKLIGILIPGCLKAVNEGFGWMTWKSQRDMQVRWLNFWPQWYITKMKNFKPDWHLLCWPLLHNSTPHQNHLIQLKFQTNATNAA